MKRKKHEGKLVRNKIQIICFVIFIMCILYISNDFYYNYQEDKSNKKIARIFYENRITEPIEFKKKAELQTETELQTELEIKAEPKTETMLYLEEIQKENPDIIGWITIPETNINYPVLQSEDNSYYLVHNYENEYSENGSIFLDNEFDIAEPSANYLIYGHRNRYGKMFDDLINYKQETFYKEHPIIQFTTAKEDATYEIIAVFLSRVYNKNETDVFRYYCFTNVKEKEEFDYYVKSSKEASLYEIDKTAEYGDQLLTLSTCEYSQKDGRLAVVARKIEHRVQE